MKTLINAFVFVLTVGLAVIVLGQSIRFYQEHPREVQQMQDRIVDAGEQLADLLVDSWEYILEAAK